MSVKAKRKQKRLECGAISIGTYSLPSYHSVLHQMDLSRGISNLL